MKRIKESPSQASKIKINHYSNIGVIEIFLEAIPTAFLLVLISIVGLSTEVDGTSGLSYVLIGVGYVDVFKNDLEWPGKLGYIELIVRDVCQIKSRQKATTGV